MASARFLSVEHLPRLTKAMAKGADESSTPEGFDDGLRRLADAFGNPRFIARTYVGSHCQSEADDDERRPLFATVDAFLEGDGDGPLLVLGEAGSGKSSLLVMLKLLHLAGLWPKHHHCELLALIRLLKSRRSRRRGRRFCCWMVSMAIPSPPRNWRGRQRASVA